MPPPRVVPRFDPLEDRLGQMVLVSHRVVSSSSRCIVDQNDSIIVLSTEEATRPIDPSRPA
jgi:hypothetical protein